MKPFYTILIHLYKDWDKFLTLNSPQKGYCWKQCLNKENECVVNHRGFTYAVNTEGTVLANSTSTF